MAIKVKMKPLWVMVAVMLAGCTAPAQQPELNKLHNQVGKLNSEMRQLTTQAASLEQQNMLNSSSENGAWLLPATNTAVPLKSQLGEVRLSLSHVESEANGTRAMLHIRSAAENTLPAFSFQVEWGEMDATTGKPLQAASQSQAISIADSLLPRSEITVPLRLSNISPEQLGYLRVHDIVAKNAPPASAP
ncbi:DUF3251 domain-containing protein [Erwinia sp. MMLR14_017]|uniref:DUF3251 domain-containing protein n=1 Tax=Erwinia sp. MMLR14_017 TaxID=3093842 RepID=UPI00298FDD25|nr:DUF3251 domain-containing protein [Erwinia sp. MMLR14_017]MDW8845877.1 DUF3251 domain-containing protein [Erwinia sp. MMLR14_017]